MGRSHPFLTCSLSSGESWYVRAVFRVIGSSGWTVLPARKPSGPQKVVETVPLPDATVGVLPDALGDSRGVQAGGGALLPPRRFQAAVHPFLPLSHFFTAATSKPTSR